MPSEVLALTSTDCCATAFVAAQRGLTDKHGLTKDGDPTFGWPARYFF